MYSYTLYKASPCVEPILWEKTYPHVYDNEKISPFIMVLSSTHLASGECPMHFQEALLATAHQTRRIPAPSGGLGTLPSSGMRGDLYD